MDTVKLIKPSLPLTWDYDESVKDVKAFVYKWKNLSTDIAEELWIAREMLSEHGGDRKSDQRNKSSIETWTQYCKDIDSSRQIVNRWLKQWYGDSKKEQRLREIEEQKKKIESGEISLPEGVFDIIVVDPPWQYGGEYDPDSRRVASPYPEMSQDGLKEINLGADDDCILWLWTTHRFIWDAKELLDHWGFKYKAAFVWDKEKMGMGSWLRMQCEFCLLGIKGKPLWDVKDMRDILRDARGEHSSKPDKFYEMIDEKFTSKRKADFFGRKERPGWKIK